MQVFAKCLFNSKLSCFCKNIQMFPGKMPFKNCRKFPKPSCTPAGGFRNSRNQVAPLQEAFGIPETKSHPCRRLSEFPKPSCTPAGGFRSSRNLVVSLRVPFGVSETLSHPCRSLSEFPEGNLTVCGFLMLNTYLAQLLLWSLPSPYVSKIKVWRHL